MTTTRAWPVALVLAGLLAPPARAQQTAGDSRWQAWLGCWTAVQADTLTPVTQLCVIPAVGTSAVDIVQVADLQVVARSHIEADGERHPSAHDACTGWERAEWSPDGRRLLLRTEHDCAGEAHRITTAIMAMTGESQWLAVQGANAGGRQSVQVQRYAAAPGDLAIPEEVVTALGDSSADRRAARLAAAAPIGPAEVIAASRQVDAIVLEAWLTVTAGAVRFNGRQLAQLADGNVPPSTIDLLVALANPRVFAVATEEPGREHIGGVGSYGTAFQYSPFASGARRYADPDSLMRCASYTGEWYPMPEDYRYDRGRCRRYGYGRGHGWYDNRPVVQVVASSGSTTPPKGRAVNGRGYTTGGDPADRRQTVDRPSAGTSSRDGGANGDGERPAAASPGGGYSGGSNTGSTDRTAKPRP